MFFLHRRRKLIKHYPEVAGVLSGSYAFCGPWRVELHVTNRCNSQCLLCWTHAPSVMQSFSEYITYELPLETVYRLIDDLTVLGTRLVSLSGGGEPLCYPGIWDVIKQLHERGISCTLNTNGLLLDERAVELLIAYEVKTVIVSVWAASDAVYHKLHPGAPVGSFDRLLQTVQLLVEAKKKQTKVCPALELFQVICSLNYHEIPEMFSLADRLGVDICTLTPMDVIKGKTEQYLLNAQQRQEIITFLSAYMNQQRQTHETSALHIRWASDFLRRMNALHADCGMYDETFAAAHPCYTGWAFAEVEASGNVASCCKSTQYPLGSLKEQSFRQLWNGKQQQQFRKKMNWYIMGKERFCDVSCRKVCDNADDIRYIQEHMDRVPGDIQRKIKQQLRFPYI